MRPTTFPSDSPRVKSGAASSHSSPNTSMGPYTSIYYYKWLYWLHCATLHYVLVCMRWYKVPLWIWDDLTYSRSAAKLSATKCWCWKIAVLHISPCCMSGRSSALAWNPMSQIYALKAASDTKSSLDWFRMISLHTGVLFTQPLHPLPWKSLPI